MTCVKRLIGITVIIIVLAAGVVAAYLPINVTATLPATRSIKAFIATLVCWGSVASAVTDPIVDSFDPMAPADRLCTTIITRLAYWPALGGLIWAHLDAANLAAGPADVLGAFFEAAAANPAGITVGIMSAFVFQVATIWQVRLETRNTADN